MEEWPVPQIILSMENIPAISQRSEPFEGLDAFREKVLESLDPGKNFEQNLVNIGILI